MIVNLFDKIRRFFIKKNEINLLKNTIKATQKWTDENKNINDPYKYIEEDELYKGMWIQADGKSWYVHTDPVIYSMIEGQSLLVRVWPTDWSVSNKYSAIFSPLNKINYWWTYEENIKFEYDIFNGGLILPYHIDKN